MNDRFRFRAWNKEYESYAYEIQAFGSFYPNPYWQDSFADFFDDDDWIIEQCTGLKDKNGKLIYENDIIDTPNGIYSVAVDDFGLWTAIYKGNPLKDVVEWSDIVKNYAFNKENVEIVILGNVHENKELLDEQ